MRIVELTKEAKENILENLLKRSPNSYGQYEETVKDILADVKENKDKAIFEYTKKFDKADINAENIRVTEEEIEEERRLFYVAMTRAKRKLIISYVKQKNGKDMNPSRFVDELLLV